ncbi:MAG: alpha/beta hydrolase [Anaerolineae bacterium]|nr:alpha/beta hydrolase [Anaerolineae bacterium]
MAPSDIAPELRDQIQKIPPIPVSNALFRGIIAAVGRLPMGTRTYEGVRLERHTTPDGIRLRIFTPERGLTGAALLWIHGGGMVIGTAAQDDPFCADTARELGIVVVSTEYRLAPKFPFPAALDDCFAAWNWLQQSAAQFRLDPTRIAIGGQSAGGGLAASLIQRIHDAGGTQPAAQWLFCPMLDDRTAARQELDVINHKIWNNQQNRFGWRAFLGREPGADQVPAYAVAARRERLEGLPPAWVGVGDIELFFEEDKTYAERLKAAGVPCTLDIVPAAPHGFESIVRNAQLTRDYLARGRAWLRQQLVG